jgi:hypothetical protein
VYLQSSHQHAGCLYMHKMHFCRWHLSLHLRFRFRCVRRHDVQLLSCTKFCLWRAASCCCCTA